MITIIHLVQYRFSFTFMTPILAAVASIHRPSLRFQLRSHG
jgi:hypothetical protein